METSDLSQPEKLQCKELNTSKPTFDWGGGKNVDVLFYSIATIIKINYLHLIIPLTRLGIVGTNLDQKSPKFLKQVKCNLVDL